MLLSSESSFCIVLELRPFLSYLHFYKSVTKKLGNHDWERHAVRKELD